MIKTCINSFILMLTKPFHFLREYPVLYHGKNINIVNFGVFAALDGIAIMIVFYWYMYTHIGFLSRDFLTLTLLTPVFVWSGAKLYYFAALGKKFVKNPMKYLVQTGFYVQGGIIGAIVWGVFASTRLDISFFLLADALCLGTFLGQFFGRLGCFNYGCCYGKETHAHCGLGYHNHESKVLRIHPELEDKNLHPTQLYEAMMNLVMFIIMLIVTKTTNSLGLTTVVFFAYQGLVRILLEFFRGDIYFHNKRNWLTFYTSVASIVVSIMLFLTGPLIDKNFLSPSLLVINMNLKSLIVMLGEYPIVTGIITVSAIFLFIGYGFHGKNIGYFPNIKEILNNRRLQKSKA